MKNVKLFLLLTIFITATTCIAVKKDSGLGTRYKSLDIVGPRHATATQNLATSQFQTNISKSKVNVDGTYSIEKPGQYYLSKNLIFDPVNNTDHNVVFHIKANNVILDLNSNLVEQSADNTTLDMIAIKIDPNLHHITIRNGIINHVSGIGIFISEGCSNVTVNQMHISDCVQGGLISAGTEENHVKNVTVVETLFNFCNGDPTVYGDTTNTYDAMGAKLDYTDQFMIQSCGFHNNETTNNDQSYGLLVRNCLHGTVYSSSFLSNKAVEEAYGIMMQESSTIELHSCHISDTQSSQEEAYGCALFGTNNCKIYRTEILGTKAKKDCFGFWMQGIELEGPAYFGSHFNSFMECESSENNSTDSNCYGFFSSGNENISFLQCTAQANKSGTTASSISAGFYLARLTEYDTDYHETLASIEHCYSKGNVASDSTGIGGGIVMQDVETCHIDSNWTINNTGSGNSYGVADLSSTSTSLIMNNYAFGHTKNYSATYGESNADMPVASGSIGDFRPLNVATVFSNLEWIDTPNETLNS